MTTHGLAHVLFLIPIWVTLSVSLPAMSGCAPAASDDGTGTGLIGQTPEQIRNLMETEEKETNQTATGPAQNPVPWENRKETSEPPLPDEDTEDRVRELFKAMKIKAPDALERWYLPLDIAMRIKDMHMGSPTEEQRAVRSWHAGQLTRSRNRFSRLISGNPFDLATFESIELGTCRFVQAGADFNRLAYWNCEKNLVYYHVEGERKHFTVRQLINWGRSWYVREW